jgi:hypothetical protein
MSGLGGGTVYCLTLLHRRAGLPNANLEFAEDAGHLGGVAIAIIGVLLLGWTAGSLPIVGAFWAALAALTMSAMSVAGVLDQRARNKRESFHADQ